MGPRWYQSEAKARILEYITSPREYGDDGFPVPRNPLVAMPTGTGKSLVIGDVAATIVQTWPGMRVVMATHVKELVEQNAKELTEVIWPGAPLGIFSAGLKEKKRSALLMPIIYGGIKTLMNVAADMPKVDVLMIDEAHLLSPKETTTYQAFIAALMRMNPWLIVIGFTATPYRMGIGSLTNNGIFTELVYDCTDVASFNRLVREGYLSPLFPRRMQAMIDVSKVGMSNGDFKANELAEATDDPDLIRDLVSEFLAHAQNRRCGLIFVPSIEMTEHVQEAFAWRGVNVLAVHSEMKPDERDRRIAAFKCGEVPALVNKDILTTGFNHRPIDIIGMWRATASTGLWVQMLGRGTRPSPETGKTDCLVLDNAGNTSRLGPINDPVIPKLKKGGVGTAPIWICSNCQNQNHARAPFCERCGFKHDMSEKLDAVSGTEELMRTDLPIIQTFDVDRVVYNIHTKEGKPDSLRVSYICGLKMFSEWVCLEHPNPVGHRAREWWRRRMGGEPPATTAEAYDVARNLKEPVHISVHVNRDYPEITGVEF